MPSVQPLPRGQSGLATGPEGKETRVLTAAGCPECSMPAQTVDTWNAHGLRAGGHGGAPAGSRAVAPFETGAAFRGGRRPLT